MLLVTRPREQAHEWVARLTAAGVPARVMPLLGIHPAPHPQAVVEAWQGLATCRAVMFVSPNAVAGFFAAAPSGAPWPGGVLAVAPGPGTAAALIAQGVSEACIVQPAADAAQFDSESLWPELERYPWQEARVLVARGEGGRDWLIQRWAQAGARVHTVTAYTRGAPDPSEQERQTLRAAVQRPAEHVWLLSSSEALDHLLELVQALGALSGSLSGPLSAPLLDHWLGQARALATHPRIFDRARQLGLRHVSTCRADFASVVAAYNRPHREP
jgi:uroporphyrinogen-III synthase